MSYLRGEITFTRTNDRVLVEGVVETAVQAQCSRSLEMFELPLSVPLEDVAFFLPGEYTSDPDQRLREDGRIDLTETLREHIIMAMPINPISPTYRDDASASQLIDQEDADWLRVKWARADSLNEE
ncbi:MAG: YceD family protein [Candidatus Roseilinea sp.]|uniref:YceD family protein n=1 Tax=Candidatus Roseilinea sp. TaxID=2838777 RepID=UPI00404AD11B